MIAESALIEFVEHNIHEFHQKRYVSIQNLKLKTVLKRKNPYLFRAKNLAIASDLVRSIVDAYLSSQEETIFGEFLERLAIFVSENYCNGSKSAA